MRRRKIYYVPGLISLMILLPLSYSALQKKRASHDYRIVEVITANAANISRDPFYNKPYPTYPPARDYLTFVLTGNAVRDKIKLDYAQLHIREIETTEELTHGVNFHFTDSAKYWSFVKALDILSQEKATHYIAEHRDIWFWTDPTEEPEPMTSEVEILSKDWLLQL